MARLKKHAGWINAIGGTGRGCFTEHSLMKPEIAYYEEAMRRIKLYETRDLHWLCDCRVSNKN